VPRDSNPRRFPWLGDLATESADFSAFTQFVGSRDGFDLWFKEQLAGVTRLDLNNPPEIHLPALLSAYELGVPAPAQA
jgi:hypothetical protein